MVLRTSVLSTSCSGNLRSCVPMSSKVSAYGLISGTAILTNSSTLSKTAIPGDRGFGEGVGSPRLALGPRSQDCTSVE